MLKSFLLFFAVAVLVLSATTMQGRQRQEATPAPALPPSATEPPAQVPAPAAVHNPVKPTQASQARAKNLYQIDCAVCHGDNGNGKTDLAKSMEVTLADWTDPKALAILDDGMLFNVIRNGKDKMPSEGSGRAKDDEVWNLIIYIRNFSKPQPMVP